MRAGLALELDRDVLGDVTEPRAVLEPFAEAAAAAERARVLADARHDFSSFVVKPRIVFDGQSSSTPRSTSSRMHGS